MLLPAIQLIIIDEPRAASSLSRIPIPAKHVFEDGFRVPVGWALIPRHSPIKCFGILALQHLMTVSEFSLEFRVKVGRPHAKAKGSDLLLMADPQQRGVSRPQSTTGHSSGPERHRSRRVWASNAGQHVDGIVNNGRILFCLPRTNNSSAMIVDLQR